VVSVNLFWLPDGNKLTKAIVTGDGKRARVNIEKVQKIAKAVRNIELLVEFKSR
jgi:hypothetical protein